MPAPLVAVVGSSNTDLVITTPRLPRPGETLLGGDFRRFQGGKGANQAVAAARAGARVLFVGACGDDDFGRAARAGLKAEGIDVSAFVTKPDHPSGVALILLGGRDRQNQIVVARSANEAFSPDDLDAVQSKLAKARVIVTQLEIPLPTVRRAAEIAARAGALFILNPAPAPARARALSASLLKQVQVLTPNEHEAELLTGEASPEKAAATLLKRGCRHVVLTLGAQGVLLASDGGPMLRIAAPRVKAVDTVGAGDCFTGWLAAGLAEGLDVEQASRRATMAAALKVTRPGAQAGMPRPAEVLRAR